MGAARRLPEDRHAGGVAAEGGDVVPHPGEPEDHVAHAVVRVAAFELEEAVDVDAVVERHQHDAVPCEGGTVEARIVVVAVGGPTTRNPHHHGTALGAFGRPDVEHQRVAASDHALPVAGGLQGNRTRLRRVAHAFPRGGRHGRQKAAFGRVGILAEGDVPEDDDLVGAFRTRALEPPARNAHARGVGRLGSRSAARERQGRRGGGKRRGGADQSSALDHLGSPPRGWSSVVECFEGYVRELRA